VAERNEGRITENLDDGTFDTAEVLTAREREILDAIAQGLEDEMIAAGQSDTRLPLLTGGQACPMQRVLG
jgi:hypothetical protein